MYKSALILKIILLFIIGQQIALGSSFESCLLKVKITKNSNDVRGSGDELSLVTVFTPSKSIGSKDAADCKKFIGQSIKKPLRLKSKQSIPFIKKGHFVTLDYSHFIIDKNDPSLNMEVWKIVNIPTKRSDHD